MGPDKAGEEGLYLCKERGRYLYREGLEQIEEFVEDTHFYQITSANQECSPLCQVSSRDQVLISSGGKLGAYVRDMSGGIYVPKYVRPFKVEV